MNILLKFCVQFFITDFNKVFWVVIIKLLLRDTSEKQEVMESYWVSLDVNCPYIVD